MLREERYVRTGQKDLFRGLLRHYRVESVAEADGGP